MRVLAATVALVFGPVEMDHEQLAAELTESLGRKIVFENVSIEDYSKFLRTLGMAPYVIQHFEGAPHRLRRRQGATAAGPPRS